MSGNAMRAAQRCVRQALGSSCRIAAGQPIHETHPELLAEGEIQPGLTGAEFAERRRRLAASLPPGGLALIQSNPETYMAGVIPYPYRQNADFQYLTGIVQPGPIATIESDGRYTLFVPDEDAWSSTWNGDKVNVDGALTYFAADDAFPLSEMPSRLAPLLSSAATIALDTQRRDNSKVWSILEACVKRQSHSICPLAPIVHRLRWRKSAAEVMLMHQSAEIAANAMVECMQRSLPGENEHTIASLFEWNCKKSGAHRLSYPPVVASGSDACTIHYGRNDKPMAKDSLLLMDAGCEYHGYCSDITRTWPVSGKYIGAQRALYETVLDMHNRLVDAVRPGATLLHLHRTSIRMVAQSLKDLGLLKQYNTDEIIERQYYRQFYPHSVGHWLGMDTHDVASIPHDRPLEAGVCLTVEPGVYVPNDESKYGAFAGLGVRLEDDVAVTQEGRVVLSAAVPILPVDVEAVIGQRM